MKRMLFNATHAEELRVAIVDGQKLIDIDIESAGHEARKSNIYKGVITRVEPSLEACFINYGEERHGFLPFKEISKAFFKEGVEAGRARIQDAMTEGQEVIVQVDKEERGTKGAALTTFISLAGRYLVLMPNNPRGGGVSRRIEGEDRQELRDAMDQLDIPSGMSIIARTAGIGRTAEELQWDLNYLMQLWRAVESAATSAPGTFLIYQESSLVIRAIRDYFTPDVGEILIDTEDIYEQAKQFMAHVMPDNVVRVKRYRDDVPLFSRFQIEHQIETAYSRVVPLPSGGAIVIDHSEALVAIDVNSARATKGSDIEETALRTNLEAADEAARQMRLRDLGGLIVIDFIDMENSKNQREVEQRLKESLHYDRARVQTGKISRFGLMELSRQRLRPALNEGTHITCPRCNGTGVIRDVESSALHVLRVIQEESMKENTATVHAQVPVDVATYLLNEKRAEIAKMEARLKVEIMLIPNKHIETPHYRLDRLRHDDERLNSYRASYAIADGPAEDSSYLDSKFAGQKPRQEAVVKGVTPGAPAPVAQPSATASDSIVPASLPAAVAAVSTATEGFFGRILRMIRRVAANETLSTPGSTTVEPAPAQQLKSAITSPSRASDASKRGGRDDNRRDGRSRGGRGRDGRRDERPPREPREARPRDDRAAAQQGPARADDEAASGGRGRGPRGPRRPRDGSTEQAAGEQVDSRADQPNSDRPARAERSGRADRPPRSEKAQARDADPAIDANQPGQESSAAALVAVAATVDAPQERNPEGSPRRPRPEHAQAETQSGDDDSDAQTAVGDEGDSDTDTGESEQRPRSRRRRGGRRSKRADRPDGNDESGATDGSPTGADSAAQDVPAVRVEPAEVAEPAAAVKPSEAVEAVASVKPAETARPAPETEPVVLARPAEVAKPDEVAQVAQVAQVDTVAESAEAGEATARAEHAPRATPAAQPARADTAASIAADAPQTVAEAKQPTPAETAAAASSAVVPADEPVLPKEELESIVDRAGLQWVETRQTEIAFEEAPAPASRPQRKRRQRAAIADAPLKQVETRDGDE